LRRRSLRETACACDLERDNWFELAAVSVHVVFVLVYLGSAFGGPQLDIMNLKFSYDGAFIIDAENWSE